jgi:glycosyltransferase involved in cell wall biosynthesis
LSDVKEFPPAHSPRVSVSAADCLRVTVITPTFNQAQFIAACIDSVLRQTHRNIEYLIYDALSNDGTDANLAPYLSDSRIRYIRACDEGQSDAINKGLDAATGDIVCWLNSDDFLFDDTVLSQVCEFFVQNPDIDAITGNGYLANVDGALVTPLIAKRDCINARRMANADYFMQPSTFWRRNDLRLDKTLSFTFDWKFFVTMYKAGMSIAYLPAYLSVYRPHEASKTKQDSALRRWEVCHVVEFAGAAPAQRCWCRIVYGLYALSERLRFPLLKTITWTANAVMRRITRGRVFSC